jgi:acyl dehydratase
MPTESNSPKIHVGSTFGPYEGRVDADAAMAYALATNDPNAACVEGRSVPPVYTVSLILPGYIEANQKSVDPGAIANVRGGVHGSHDLYVHRPVPPGQKCRWTVETYSATQTGAGVGVAQKIAITDLDGAPLVDHYWTTMYIGGQIPADLGPAPADHTFPPEAHQHPLGSHTFQVAGDQTFRYAGASTDHANIHIDDEAAQRAGFPSKFLQGLCTFAMCSGAVVKLAADGDPDAVARLAGRFSSPVFPRNELTVDVFDAGTTPEGGRAIAFEATSAGATVLRHGRAELRPS